MLSERKNFDYDDYLRTDKSWSDYMQTIWQNLALSIASTTEYVINDTLTSDAIGLGFRTTILNGKVDGRVKKAYLIAKEYEDEISRVNTKVLLEMENYMNELYKQDSSWQIKNLRDAFVSGEKLEKLSIACTFLSTSS